MDVDGWWLRGIGAMGRGGGFLAEQARDNNCWWLKPEGLDALESLVGGQSKAASNVVSIHGDEHDNIARRRMINNKHRTSCLPLC